jgi:hypothetical protein
MTDQGDGQQYHHNRRSYRLRRFESFIEQKKSKTHQQRAEQRRNASVDRAVRGTARATWVIAIVGTIALSLGILQYIVLKGQLDEMKAAGDQTERAIAATNRLADQAASLAEESRKSAIATRQLANAATKANEISQQALVGVQRPFMFVQNMTAEPFFVTIPTTVGPKVPPKAIGQKILGGWIGDIQWENSGNTATKNLVITTHCIVSGKDIPDPFAVLIAQPGNKLLGGEDVSLVFGPKQIHIGGSCKIDTFTAALGELFAPYLQRYAFGTARYTGNLDSQKRYRTDFCYSWGVAGGELATEFEGAKNPPPVYAVSRPCQIHNCADDECKKQDEISIATAATLPADLGLVPLSTKK